MNLRCRCEPIPVPQTGALDRTRRPPVSIYWFSRCKPQSSSKQGQSTLSRTENRSIRGFNDTVSPCPDSTCFSIFKVPKLIASRLGFESAAEVESAYTVLQTAASPLGHALAKSNLFKVLVLVPSPAPCPRLVLPLRLRCHASYRFVFRRPPQLLVHSLLLPFMSGLPLFVFEAMTVRFSSLRCSRCCHPFTFINRSVFQSFTSSFRSCRFDDFRLRRLPPASSSNEPRFLLGSRGSNEKRDPLLEFPLSFQSMSSCFLRLFYDSVSFGAGTTKPSAGIKAHHAMPHTGR